jgi:hypothetical protein
MSIEYGCRDAAALLKRHPLLVIPNPPYVLTFSAGNAGEKSAIEAKANRSKRRPLLLPPPNSRLA